MVVDDTQLSLAIGKKGQNVRLAAKLLGWKIDIKSEEEKRKEVEAQLAGIEFGDANQETKPLALPDIHDEVVAVLKAAGYDTVDKLLDAPQESLLALQGFDAETVEAVLAAARIQQERDAAEALQAAADREAREAQEAQEALESPEAGDATDAAGAAAAEQVEKDETDAKAE